MSAGERNQLRRWIEDRRAAADREREAAQSNGFAPDPIRSALELIAVAGRLHGWPMAEDAVTRREDERSRACWARLREVMGGR